ncbi:MAG: hypothetical protein ACK4MV_04460 [Beijerinckiaceae bacterium]
MDVSRAATLNFTISGSTGGTGDWSGVIEIGDLSVPVSGSMPDLLSATSDQASGSFAPDDFQMISDFNQLQWTGGFNNLFLISSADLYTQVVTNSASWSSLAGQSYALTNDPTAFYFGGSIFPEEIAFSQGGTITFSDPNAIPEMDGSQIPKVILLLATTYVIRRSIRESRDRRAIARA